MTTIADVIVFDAKGPADGAANWWAAKCKHCGQFITKYDFTAWDALALAVKVGCRCRRA